MTSPANLAAKTLTGQPLLLTQTLPYPLEGFKTTRLGVWIGINPVVLMAGTVTLVGDVVFRVVTGSGWTWGRTLLDLVALLVLLMLAAATSVEKRDQYGRGGTMEARAVLANRWCRRRFYAQYRYPRTGGGWRFMSKHRAQLYAAAGLSSAEARLCDGRGDRPSRESLLILAAFNRSNG